MLLCWWLASTTCLWRCWKKSYNCWQGTRSVLEEQGWFATSGKISFTIFFWGAESLAIQRWTILVKVKVFCKRFCGDWQQQKVSTRRSPSLRRVGPMLSRRDLCSLQEQKRFFFTIIFYPIKVFLTHMEIIRVKYPNSLHRLHKEAASSSRWFFSLCRDGKR